jgi:hypothetical protein
MAITLTERDRALLDHMRRYRITIPDAVESVVCNGDENAAKKLVHRLNDYVASEPLGSREVYYRLTPAGAKFVAAPGEVSRPLGPQALPKAIGILAYCCLAEEKRQRYVRQEFMEDFPELVKSLLGKDFHTDYFLDFHEGQARFGEIVVELGGDYKKFLSKCRARLREYLDIPHLRDIVVEGLFSFAIITGEEAKAEAMRAELAQKPLESRVSVEVAPVLNKCLPLVGNAS